MAELEPSLPAGPQASAKAASHADLIAALTRDALAPEKPVRRVLYTWTTQAQMNSLLSHRRLLTQDKGGGGKLSLFDQRLRKHARDPVEKILLTHQMKYRRFAWVNAWATVRGPQGTDYGRQLIRVTLKENAIIARLDARSRRRWSFFDLQGGAMPEKTALVDQERIAAIYHVFRPGDDGIEADATFREFVLCNESMIERWEIATEALSAEVTQWLQTLASFRRALIDRGPIDQRTWQDQLEPNAWRSDAPRDVMGSYDAGLAFADPLYAPRESQVKTVIDMLRAKRPHGIAVAHRVRVKLGSPVPLLPPPAPKFPCDFTMGCP